MASNEPNQQHDESLQCTLEPPPPLRRSSLRRRSFNNPAVQQQQRMSVSPNTEPAQVQNQPTEQPTENSTTAATEQVDMHATQMVRRAIRSVLDQAKQMLQKEATNTNYSEEIDQLMSSVEWTILGAAGGLLEQVLSRALAERGCETPTKKACLDPDSVAATAQTTCPILKLSNHLEEWHSPEILTTLRELTVLEPLAPPSSPAAPVEKESSEDDVLSQVLASMERYTAELKAQESLRDQARRQRQAARQLPKDTWSYERVAQLLGKTPM